MQTAARPDLEDANAPVGSTLLELVTRLTETTDSAEETVEAALEILDSGRVYLTGNFRGCRLVA
jgi:hypothetical protein